MTPASSYRIFVVLWVASLLIWWQAIAATLALALHQDAYTHILLILPISIGLIGTEWNRRKWKPSPSILRGSALLGVAVLIGVAGLRWGRVDVFTGDVRLSLEILAVVMWWVGSFVCCFGGRIFRRCIFPLLFLLWLVPIPEFALDYIVYLLQLGSALAARLLFTMAGIPVSQDGAVVAIPGLTLEVAKECSSIRSSLMLLVTTMVIGPPAASFVVGKDAYYVRRNSSFHCQERTANLHPFGAWHLCRPWISEWQASPSGWDNILSVISSELVRPDLDRGLGGAQGGPAGTQRSGFHGH